MITRRTFFEEVGIATLGAAITPARITRLTETTKMKEEIKLIKPDNTREGRRIEFDIENGVIVYNKVLVEFVFLGDSITNWWELNAYFHSNNGIIVNRGSAGDDTPNIKKRFEADVVQLKPKNVIALIGINNPYQVTDLATMQPLYPSQQPHDKIIAELKQDVEEMILMAKKNNIRFILCSLLPMATTDTEMQTLVVKINEMYKELTGKHDIIYVDYYASWVQKDGVSQIEGLTEDTVHPVVFGYNIMAKVLKETLTKHEISL